jgi:hypothetical protein
MIEVAACAPISHDISDRGTLFNFSHCLKATWRHGVVMSQLTCRLIPEILDEAPEMSPPAKTEGLLASGISRRLVQVQHGGPSFMCIADLLAVRNEIYLLQCHRG